VRFSAEQSITAPRDAVEAAFVDPGFYAALGELSAIRPPEVLEQRVEGADDNFVHLRVQYAFSGNLSGPARAVLDPARLTWVDQSTFEQFLASGETIYLDTPAIATGRGAVE